MEFTYFPIKSELLTDAVAKGKSTVFNALGYQALQANDAKRAAFLFNQSIAINTEDASAHNNLGVTWIHQNRIEQGIECFKLAVSLRPQMLKATLNLVLAYMTLHNYVAAKQIIEEAYEASPNDLDVLCVFAQLLFLTRQLDAGTEILRKALAISPNHLSALIIWAKLGLPESLLELQARLAEALPLAHTEDARFQIWLALAENSRLLGRGHEEISYYDHALLIEPMHVATRVNRAKAMLLLGDFSNGWREFLWRWNQPTHILPRRGHLAPLWLGEDLLNNTAVCRARSGRYVAVLSLRDFGCSERCLGMPRSTTGTPSYFGKLINQHSHYFSR
jgi:tetratricopeptide (TPR) repeat protein